MNQTVTEQVARLYNDEPLTDFASISPATRLEGLNLNWKERDLPERSRTKHVHRLHPYMGKFIPQLVEIFLRKYEPQLVYDPFVGSGTTLVEAKSLGIDSIGTDVSEFNVLLSRVKTANYNIDSLEKEIYQILSELKEFNKQPEIQNDYVNKWFSPRAAAELSFFLSRVSSYKNQDVLKIIASRSARSARLVTHFDLDFPKQPQDGEYYCHKHRRTCRPVEEAYKFLYRYSLDTLKRLREFSDLNNDAKVVLNHADSRSVKLPKDIDFVFTSPPYVGLIDYHDQHRYAYELLGLTDKEIDEIGPAKKGQSHTAKRAYSAGINDVFLHTRDHMSQKGIMAIVVNDKYNLYDPSRVGFRQIERLERHVNRRTGRRSGAFYESILIWQKI